MKHCLLSPSERIDIEMKRSKNRDKDVYVKLSVLICLDEGLTMQQTATLLGISDTTVYNYKVKYEQCNQNENSLAEYLNRNYVAYCGRMSDEQLAMLEDEVEQGLYSQASEVAEWINQKFGIVYKYSAVRYILKKLGFVHKKTMQLPGNVNVEEQEKFLAEMEPFLEEISENEEAVFFMDAVHPQHNTRSDYVYVKKGKEKQVPSNTGRRRININAAMNFHNPADVHFVEAESVNAQTTQQLLQKILDNNPDKQKIYIFADNARYYYSLQLQQWIRENPKLVLIFLPPYSPNLNLIERLWKFMRKKVINLHFYSKYEEFRNAILSFFDNLEQYKQELLSLITPNFQRFAPTV